MRPLVASVRLGTAADRERVVELKRQRKLVSVPQHDGAFEPERTAYALANLSDCCSRLLGAYVLHSGAIGLDTSSGSLQPLDPPQTQQSPTSSELREHVSFIIIPLAGSLPCPLMISLALIKGDKLRDGSAKVAFAERNQAIETVLSRAYGEPEAGPIVHAARA